MIFRSIYAKKSEQVTGRSCLLIGLSMVLAFAVCGCSKQQHAEQAPPVVEYVTVQQQDVPIITEWVGTMDGYVNAVIKPQVSGYLTRQLYREGQLVKKGQALFEIDPRSFQAAYDQAVGSLEQAKGNLASQEATYITAKADLERVRPLAKRNAVSKKDLDDAVGKEASSKASVESAKAAIASAAAAVEKARLDLDFTRITSPVDGIAGIAKAQLGNLVSPSMQNELTTVSTVDPIKVYINVSEQEHLRAQKVTDGAIEKVPLQLILADGSVYSRTGKFVLADRQIDPGTGTLKVGALFPNPNGLLRPGQFGRLRATIMMRKGALLVPQRAVTEMQGKYLVAVVTADNKADVRTVKVGERYGSDWIIEEGIKLGEKVVVEGVQKARPGSPVDPKPFVKDAAEKKEAAATAPAQAGKR
jgi:membrane fusion protein (multidrug efflux system)